MQHFLQHFLDIAFVAVAMSLRQFSKKKCNTDIGNIQIAFTIFLNCCKVLAFSNCCNRATATLNIVSAMLLKCCKLI